MAFVVRCRYIASYDRPEGGVGYLTRTGQCSRERCDAQVFDTEAEAWSFAALSGERVPDDCWVEGYE